MKESTPMTTFTPQAPVVILDEFGYYFASESEPERRLDYSSPSPF